MCWFKALVWNNFCIITERLKATGLFVILLNQDSFEIDSSGTKFQTIYSYSDFEKWLSRNPFQNSGQLFPIKIMKYQFLDIRFDQISDHKFDIYLNRKLSAKLWAKAAKRITKRTGRLLFFSQVWFQKWLIVCISVLPFAHPLKNTISLYFAKPPLSLKTV